MHGPEATYQENLAVGRLTFQRCTACKAAIHYVRVVCPLCAGQDLEVEDASGRATLYAFTLGTKRMGGEGSNVALVDLVEGPRIFSTIVDAPSEALSIGMRLEAHVEVREGKPPRLVFRPEGAP